MQPILPFLALLVPLCSARSIRRTSPCPFHGDTGHPDEQLIEDEYVVMLHQGYSLDDHFAFIGQDFSKTAREFSPMPRLNAYTVKIDAVAIHDTVRYDPGVHSVSQNRRVKLKLPVDKPIVSTSANKLRHKRQDLSTSALGDWETEQRVMHYSIRMLNRWDFQDNGPPNWFGFYHVDIMREAGKGVDIYIFDNGIDWHEIYQKHGYLRTLRGDKDYTDGGPSDKRHGTAVGGVALLNAMQATIIDVRIVEQFPDHININFEKMTRAVHDIIQDHEEFQRENPGGYRGAVMSMSIDLGDTHYGPFEFAIKQAFEAGIPFVAAAGNGDKNGRGLPQGVRPCNYDNVLCVGAANKYYQRSTYSNYDKYVDIFAPGDEIRSAYNQAYDAYAFFTGTSYATPAVAGVLASYMKYENITDNATEVISRLMSNVQYGLLSEGSIPIPNVFAHTGLRHPDKKPECPYKDVTRVTCKGPGNHTDIVTDDDQALLDSQINLEKLWVELPAAQPAKPSPCPAGCTCNPDGFVLC